MMDRETVNERVAELESQAEEYEYLRFVQDMYYLADEGFMDIDEDGRCYPKEMEDASIPYQ